jgi:prepilin peptidase CpaA
VIVGSLGAPDVALVLVLVASAATDLRLGRILNIVTYPAIVVGLLAAAAGSGVGLTSAVTGCLVGGLALYALFAAGWLGGGDVKLMAAVGAFKGYPFVLHALFYSVFAGGVCAALLLIWGGHARAVIGDLLVVARRARGVPVSPIPARGGSFPFGVAICVGTITALALELRGRMP